MGHVTILHQWCNSPFLAHALLLLSCVLAHTAGLFSCNAGLFFSPFLFPLSSSISSSCLHPLFICLLHFLLLLLFCIHHFFKNSSSYLLLGCCYLISSLPLILINSIGYDNVNSSTIVLLEIKEQYMYIRAGSLVLSPFKKERVWV